MVLLAFAASLLNGCSTVIVQHLDGSVSISRAFGSMWPTVQQVGGGPVPAIHAVRSRGLGVITTTRKLHLGIYDDMQWLIPPDCRVIFWAADASTAQAAIDMLTKQAQLTREIQPCVTSDD